MSEECKKSNCVCQGMGPVLTSMVERALSETGLENAGRKEANSHFRTARVEFLKGLRSMIDSRIEKMSKPPKHEDTGTTVPVD